MNLLDSIPKYNIKEKSVEDRLIDILKKCPSHNKAIAGRDLCRASGVKSMADLWTKIHNLRIKGNPIIDKKGDFWLSNKKADIDGCIKRTRDFINLLEVTILGLGSVEIEGNNEEAK